jgi:hypothetical protein
MIFGNLNPWQIMTVMKMSNSSKRQVINILLLVLVSSFVIFGIVRYISFSDTLQVKTYRVSEGWGYQVVVKGKVFINQPFIPTVPGKKAFPTEKSALKAGKIVKSKLIHHKSPALTMKDMDKIGLDSVGNLK